MNTSTQQDFFKVVDERHSVKTYDESVKISKEEMTKLLEIAGKAPSSWNLQHWKFMVIDDQSLQQKLLPIAYNQQQVVQASAVIAVLGDLEANKNVDKVFGPAVAAGLMPEDVKNTLAGQISNAYTYPQVARDEAIRNASLASMQLMLAARAMGYDTCPMGGYDAAKFVEAFEIPSRYVPVMLISVGKAANPARPSGRLPIDEIAVWNKF